MHRLQGRAGAGGEGLREAAAPARRRVHLLSGPCPTGAPRSFVATGDLIRTAVGLEHAASVDGLLEWLGNVLRRLRSAPAVSCGPAGHFELGAARGTQEIRPGRGNAMSVVARRQLDFVASPALERFLSEAPAPDGMPAPGDDASPHAFLLDVGTVTDSLELAFSRALALELRVHGRASIGNFGVWTLGRKPSLEVYVRFRAHVATQAFF